MRLLSYIKNMANGIYRSVKRFPITIGLAVIFVGVMIAVNENRFSQGGGMVSILERMALVIALGVPLSLCIKLIFESVKPKKKFLLPLCYACGTLFLILYYFFLFKDFSMVATTRYVAVSLALYLAFLYIPYLPGRDRFELYVIKVFTGFFITIVYTMVLFGGLSAILFTIKSLFSLNIPGKIFYYTWLICAGIFAPSYFLAVLPEIHVSFTKEDYPKIFKVLVLYIVMPLISIYTTILYVYFIKIIITRQWPVGLVSHLVLWYSVLGSGVLFFITPLKYDNSWARRFVTYFPKVILPVIVMMFFSIGIRVKAYGITENRYYVLLLGIWVFGIMFYFALKKNLINIIIPISLSIIAIVSAFGPLSSYSVSKFSQNKRLEDIFVRNNMLKEGQILQPSSNVPENDRNEVSRILDYFNKNHSLKDVRYLPEDFKIDNMKDILGFQYEDGGYAAHNIFFFRVDNNAAPIEISGYDYLFDMRRFNNQNADNSGGIDIKYDRGSGMMSITEDGADIYTKSLNEFVRELVDKYGSGQDTAMGKEKILSYSDMAFYDENEKAKVKIQFTYISGDLNVQAGNKEPYNMEFFVLVKKK